MQSRAKNLAEIYLQHLNQKAEQSNKKLDTVVQVLNKIDNGIGHLKILDLVNIFKPSGSFAKTLNKTINNSFTKNINKTFNKTINKTINKTVAAAASGAAVAGASVKVKAVKAAAAVGKTKKYKDDKEWELLKAEGKLPNKKGKLTRDEKRINDLLKTRDQKRYANKKKRERASDYMAANNDDPLYEKIPKREKKNKVESKQKTRNKKSSKPEVSSNVKTKLKDKPIMLKLAEDKPSFKNDKRGRPVGASGSGGGGGKWNSFNDNPISNNWNKLSDGNKKIVGGAAALVLSTYAHAYAGGRGSVGDNYSQYAAGMSQGLNNYKDPRTWLAMNPLLTWGQQAGNGIAKGVG